MKLLEAIEKNVMFMILLSAFALTCATVGYEFRKLEERKVKSTAGYTALDVNTVVNPFGDTIKYNWQVKPLKYAE